MAAKTLTFKGFDSWDRPVYAMASGQLVCDTDPRAHASPSIMDKDEFDGEPGFPVEGPFKFKPKRATW